MLPRWLNNILVIVCTVFSTLLTLVVLLLLTKYFKMISLIASLVISTLPPPPEATAMISPTGQLDLSGIQLKGHTLEHYITPEKMTFCPILGYIYNNCKHIVDAFPENKDPTNLTHDDWTKAAKLVKPDKSEGPKNVVCSYPITTVWSNVLETMLICYAIIKYVRPMTWYQGYKYSRNCTFYLFVFCDHYYSPLKICPLRGHLQNYKIEDSGTDLELNLTKNWIYDTVNISWGDIQVLENQIPIKLLKSATVPLRHKIKNRRMMSFD